MIGKTTRRTMMAMVGAGVSAAAVAVAPTPTFAAPAAVTNPDKPTPADIAAFKQNVAKLQTKSSATASTSTSTSPNSQAAGDCDTVATLGIGGGFTIGVPARSDGLISCALRSGDNNLAVGKMQAALIDCYGQNLGPTGADNDFGNLTLQGVKNVQNFHGVAPIDGVYDGRLLNAGFFFPIVNSNSSFIHECINLQGTVVDV